MFVNVMLIINVHTFVILAAGNGTRMCSNIPKIFTEIASKPMIRYVIECCKQFSQNIVVVTKEEFAKHDALRDVEVVIQKTPLGTGDALMCAYDLIDEYAIVLYADMPLIIDEDFKISQIRGKWLNLFDDIEVMAIFHPSYLLRNHSLETGSPRWLMKKDLSNIKAKLDEIRTQTDN